MLVSLVEAACRYAQAGIAVVPLHTPADGGGCSCYLGPQCESAGKHPRLVHGLREASADAGQVRSWWRRWPHANIGLATGSMLDVCDIDSNTGLRRVLDLLDVVRPASPLVRTGNGWHIWYAAGLPSRIGLLPDVDWRGTGGTAVAPPSLHANGSRYAFVQPWIPGMVLPECPESLRRLVVPPAPVREPLVRAGIADTSSYAQAALDGEVRRVLEAPRPLYRGRERLRAGGRNNSLNVAAFRLGQLAAAGGLDASVVWPRLLDVALSVDLRPAEAQRTIRSGWYAGLRHPRR